ncbi:MAG: YicC/YloC family endoribonuclease [Thermoanaerobaculaceae bacterium]
MGRIFSMTGLGEASGALSPRFAARVRVWSVNSKGLEVAIKISPKNDYPELELALRKMLATSCNRGKVTLLVDVQALGRERGLRCNWDLVRELQVQIAQAEPSFALGPLTFRDLLGIPGFFELPETELDQEEQQALLQLVGHALDELAESRAREALLLLPALEAELHKLREFVDFLESRAEFVRAALFAKLRQRLGELLEKIPDEQRLAQEAAILAERADVTEEKTRLAAHLKHFGEILGPGGPVGRKLDFLVQEMLREVNTAGSKLREVGVAEQVVEAKASLERLREQVANLE